MSGHLKSIISHPFTSSPFFSNLFFFLFFTNWVSNLISIMEKEWRLTFGDSPNDKFGQPMLSIIANFDLILGVIPLSCSIFPEHDFTVLSRALSIRRLCSLFPRRFAEGDFRGAYPRARHKFNPRVCICYSRLEESFYVDIFLLVLSA